MNIGLIPKVISLKLVLDMVPSSSQMLLARCEEDLFMFRFASKQRKASNAVEMSSLIL